MQIHHWDRRVDGPLNENSMRKKLEGLGYVVEPSGYPANTYLADHRHRVDKIDAVLSGTLRIRIGNDTILLQAGDSIHIPRGVTHNIKVIGAEPVVSLDATRTS